MDCNEARNQIESLEDLRANPAAISDDLAEHFAQCPLCDRYFRSSAAMEASIFSKIKDIKHPQIPAELYQAAPRRWKRNFLIAVPLACAAALILMVFLLPATDITREMLSRIVTETIGFQKVHAEDVDSMLAVFEENTGLDAVLPPCIDKEKVRQAAIIKINGRTACAFKCVKGETTMTVFVFAGRNANMQCCCAERCTCLSTKKLQTERWTTDDGLGYMIINTPEKQKE